MVKFKSKKSSNSTGRPEGKHASYSIDDKQEYSRVATAASCAKSAPSDSTSSSEEIIDATTKKVGRPPLNDSAMTPNTIKDHKKTVSVRNVRLLKFHRNEEMLHVNDGTCVYHLMVRSTRIVIVTWLKKWMRLKVMAMLMMK